MKLSEKAIAARRRQSRLPFETAPVPPTRGISKEERDAAYRALDEALQAVNGLRVIKHPQRAHLIDGLLLGLEGGLGDVLLLAEKMKASAFLKGKRWLSPNKLLTDVRFQTDVLAGVYDGDSR